MSKSALKILQTAEELFNAQSFVSVGVDLIRDTSGCSKTTMYTYYKNKQQLVKAVLLARDKRFKEGIHAAIEGFEGKAAIEALFKWHVAWSQEDHFKGCLFVRAVAESSVIDDDIIEISRQHKHWIKKLIQVHCKHMGKAVCSEVVYTIFEGYIARCLVEGFDDHMTKQIWESIDLILTN